MPASLSTSVSALTAPTFTRTASVTMSAFVWPSAFTWLTAPTSAPGPSRDFIGMKKVLPSSPDGLWW